MTTEMKGQGPVPPSSSGLDGASAARRPLGERALAERVRAVPPSGIRKFFDILATMDDVISLGVGEPDFDTPAPIVEAGIASLRRGRTHYTSNYGTFELRRALAGHLERRYGVAYDPAHEILITVGASEAVDLALRATCDPGDEVVLHEPSYVAYAPAVVFAGGVVRHVPTRLEDDFALDPAAVEAAITPRTKALFLGYPCNPTGAVLPPEVQDELAAIAVRHDLLVYSDEIYDRLAYGSYRHRAMSALPGMRDRTILMGGFSKAYAMTGWRVGYLCAPAPILEGIVKVHQYGIMSAPTTAQDAALEALQVGEPEVERMRAAYDARRRLLVDGFNALGLETFEPRGAFYAFPRITSTGLDSETFAQRLLEEEHVAVVPGGAFGPSGEGHVRACYATSEAELREALVRIGRFVARARAESGAEGGIETATGPGVAAAAGGAPA
jgi:aminotransferase